MQSKIAHAAERKAFGLVLDQIIKAGSAPDREQKLDKLLDMAGNLLKDTSPGSIRGLRKGLYPGSKWEQFLWKVIDETDHHVLKTAILNGAYEAAFRGLRNTTANAEKYQCNVPWIILFDPTSACNRHCVGCWAADYGNSLNLTYEEMDRLVTEGSELGCHLYMLTGGEPLVRKKDVLRLAEAHDDCLFNIFTNATLIDQEFCDEVRRLGNIVFSISLEGDEASNDGRRGDGSYEDAMAAFDLLHSNGLLFGTSTAYTRDNVDIVSSDDYLDTIIEKGARWAWYFHYMPVGEGANADLMPTVDQREYMLHRIREVRAVEGGKPIFAMDFQNDGEFVGGCIAGGRVYCHINARGDVEPCVFIHYSTANIKEKSLLECLRQPLFQAYRENYPWNDNMLRPCPMLENPEILPRIVHEADAPSTEYVTPEDVDHLCARTTPYAHEWEKRAEKIWLEEHPTGKKVYEDALSDEKISVKAKLIAEHDAEAEKDLV
ncbi:radical SAM protein [Olsenella profusa]|uniref:Radical SAM protein n=1 Tax=Olsenella profusa TaxID=138595 RepID=A0ABS2F0L7_9ACTN|nr:radical SAM protein [Olsenella profusa]MBM6774500.1 radical SAM protein [Olsenella profusa]